MKKKLTLIVAIIPFIYGCNSDEYIEDPLKENQWYLNEFNKYGLVSHINLNNKEYKGRGVVVSVVDNGLDLNHEDLVNNIGDLNYSYLSKNYDFNNSDHGTSCAGIIAGEEGNGIGITGIAPQAQIVGFNALRAPSVSNLADALIRNKGDVWVSNNSWGDFNSWGEPLRLRSLLKGALNEGTKNGRHGKGIIYIFSAGNGAAEEYGLPTDNVNYSGLVNNRYTIPVCAVDEKAKRATYSEVGATLVVCAPSKGRREGLGITTTDVSGEEGYNPKVFPNDIENNNYTDNFSGTSASAPMVSGVAALMLEANPELGWRDVKAILAKSARIIDKEHPDWSTNGAHININHSYGFGMVDADKAIDLSQNWRNYPEEVIIKKELQVDKLIPDDETSSITEYIDIEEEMIVEFVDIYFDAPDHSRLGDLEIILTSPFGTKSVLAEQHRESFEGFFRYKNWRFGSIRHLEENSKGRWNLTIKDKSSSKSGTFKSWGLTIYGHNSNPLRL